MNVFGVAKTKAALQKVQLQIEAAAPIAARAGAEVVARAAASRAPRRTGKLASSIQVTNSPGHGVARVASDVIYARFPEFGTTYIPGQHYMADAAEESTAGIVGAMAAIFRAATAI